MNSTTATPNQHAWPNFFLIGAPKSGTTSMSAYLSKHPEIYISHPKEPNYFNTDFSDSYRDYTDWGTYLSECFINSEGYKVRGDCTVWHLYSSKALENIMTKCPDSKFLVMLRNPVRLAQSLHAQLLYSNNEDVLDFQEAWSLQSQRSNGLSLPAHCKEAKLLQYGAICKLGQQLNRAISHIPDGQLKLVFFDDFKSDPSSAYQEVIEFLGLSEYDAVDFKQHNARKANRSKFVALMLQKVSKLPIRKIKDRIGIPRGKSLIPHLRKLNSKPEVVQSISPEFQRDLINYFSEDIQLIEKLTNRNLSHWKTEKVKHTQAKEH
jgi:hypothetical protein